MMLTKFDLETMQDMAKEDKGMEDLLSTLETYYLLKIKDRAAEIMKRVSVHVNLPPLTSYRMDNNGRWIRVDK